MKKNSVRLLTRAALIAALYVVLTWLANLLGLASGAIQVRLSEALTILPLFFPEAVPGLFVGCLLANLLTGAVFWDVLFGSLATLLGALGTLAVPRDKPYLAPIPPILANMVIVPLVLRYAYQAPGALPYLMATVGIGEVLSCGVLGMGLFWALKKRGMLPGKKTDDDPAR